MTRFVEVDDSPVLVRGASGAWDDVDVANPDVKWDPVGSRWLMNYSGFDGSTWATGLAYATTLTGPWTKEATNPVFTVPESSGIAANGSIVRLGSEWLLYFQGNDGAGTTVCMASSTNLLDWTEELGGAAAIPTGTSGQWDVDQTFDPWAFINDDAHVEVWYAGLNGSTRGIGWATSTDGRTFTKQGRFMSRPDWASSNFGEPSALRDGTELRVYFDCAGVTDVRHIGGVHVDTGETNPSRTLRGAVVLPRSGEFDSVQDFDSCVVRDGASLYLFHAGAASSGGGEGMGSDIGLAVALYRPGTL